MFRGLLASESREILGGNRYPKLWKFLGAIGTPYSVNFEKLSGDSGTRNSRMFGKQSAPESREFLGNFGRQSTPEPREYLRNLGGQSASETRDTLWGNSSTNSQEIGNRHRKIQEEKNLSTMYLCYNLSWTFLVITKCARLLIPVLTFFFFRLWYTELTKEKQSG